MAKIIKSKNIPPVVSQVKRGKVLDKKVLAAEDEAGRILEQAKMAAEKIKDEAKLIQEKIIEEAAEAKKQGFKEGESKGLAQVTEQLLALRSEKESFYADAEEQMIKLVLNISEKIMGKLVQDHKELVVGAIKNALERSIGEQVHIRVHPEDYAYLSSPESEWAKSKKTGAHIRFVEDENIDIGGCIIETEVGTIDARLEIQLAAIRKAFGMEG